MSDDTVGPIGVSPLAFSIETVLKKKLEDYRAELGNSLETIAVAQIENVPELKDITFKGASRKVLKEAKKKSLEEDFPKRSIKAPFTSPTFIDHAEEGVMAHFESEVEKKRLEPKEIVGEFYMLQSNGNGVCNMCTADLFPESKSDKIGIFKKFVSQYPKLNIHVSTYDETKGKGFGTLSFDVENKNVLKVRKQTRKSESLGKENRKRMRKGGEPPTKRCVK